MLCLDGSVLRSELFYCCVWYPVLGNHDYAGNVQAQLSEQLNRRDKRWSCHRELQLRFPICGSSIAGAFCSLLQQIVLLNHVDHLLNYEAATYDE